MNDTPDPDHLNLELPEEKSFVSTPPALTLEEYEGWCDAYWAAHGPLARSAEPRHDAEFTL